MHMNISDRSSTVDGARVGYDGRDLVQVDLVCVCHGKAGVFQRDSNSEALSCAMCDADERQIGCERVDVHFTVEGREQTTCWGSYCKNVAGDRDSGTESCPRALSLGAKLSDKRVCR